MRKGFSSVGQSRQRRRWHAHCIVYGRFPGRGSAAAHGSRGGPGPGYDCRDRGRERLIEISRVVAPRIPMDEAACHDYLERIEHQLSPTHQKGLELFFTYLVRRGEAPDNALPLKIFP